jgi:hypothetical protein
MVAENKCMSNLGYISVLWIRNDLVWIRILSFVPGQLNNWQILSGPSARLLKHFKVFLKKYVCNYERSRPLWRKICKNYTDILFQKRSIWIQPGQQVRIRPEPDPSTTLFGSFISTDPTDSRWRIFPPTPPGSRNYVCNCWRIIDFSV